MTVGFFGKVRSHGDFVSRRLPPDMVLPFDAWVQAWLVQSRLALGADWLATWSTSPLWRFVLAPGLCGPQGWTGVMMPSADRVGRCFPLILASALSEAPSLRDRFLHHKAWYAQLEELALSSLDDGFAIEAFDAALKALTPQPARAPRSTARAGHAPALAFRDMDVFVLPEGRLEAGSAWWTDGAPEAARCLAMCAGFPAPSSAAALIDARWVERGWRAGDPPGLR